jgi:hypothetical protein
LYKAFISLLISLNVVILVQSLSHITSSTLITIILDLAASIVVLPLSYLEDQRQLRPSSVLPIYFTTSLLLDLSRLWVLMTRPNPPSLYTPFVILLVVKGLLCGLENLSKETHFIQGYQDVPPEAYKGLINRTLFWWLKDLFITGVSRRITFDDMYPLDGELKSEALGSRMQRFWDERCK